MLKLQSRGLQYILCGKAELKDKESVHWCLEIAISYFSLVSPSPNMRLIGGRKNVLETQIFGVGATSYDSFFGAGRLFINTSFFIRPPPTLFLHPPSLSISLSSSHPLSPFIHSSYSMPPKASTKKSQAKEVALVAPKYVIFL